MRVRPLRVATWNVREGVPVDPTADPTPLWEPLITADVDVAALQEVRFPRHGGSDALAAVARRAGLTYKAPMPLSPSSFHTGDAAGVVVLSRFPILDQRGDLLPNPHLQTTANGTVINTHDKGVMSATMEWEGRKIRVLSLHAFPFHRFDRRADDKRFAPIWSDLAAKLEQNDGQPVVACGDFNTDRRDLLINRAAAPLRQAIGQEVTHAGRAVDDILYSGGLVLIRRDVIPTLSDHALCIAEFRAVAPAS